MVLRCMFGVLGGMHVMGVRQMRMMRGLAVIARIVMLCGLGMMMCGQTVMMRGLAMLVSCVF